LFSYRWSVKITYYTNTDDTVRHVWHSYEDTESRINVEDHTWIKLNKDQIGYYRVNYPEDMWQSLTEALIANISVNKKKVLIIFWKK